MTLPSPTPPRFNREDYHVSDHSNYPIVTTSFTTAPPAPPEVESITLTMPPGVAESLAALIGRQVGPGDAAYVYGPLLDVLVEATGRPRRSFYSPR